MERQHDTFRYGPDQMVWFEQFTLEPVPPETVREHARDGQTLATMDIPDYLERSLAPTVDPGPALYRLVQLFGTPNVPGLEAGAVQPERERTTWQYLFRVIYTPGEAEPPVPAPSEETEYLVSVYDYRTNLSVGLSGWQEDADDRTAAEPSKGPISVRDLPDEGMLVSLVQLVLATVEHPVSATYKELWV